MATPATQDRLHYMDHLRALAMLAGVLFHAALAYSPLMHRVFPTADRQHSVWVDVVIWALHLVRMPLFFLVAGYFTSWTLERQGGGALARQRVRRILVPLLLAWPPVWLSLSASTVWAATHVQHPSAVLQLVREWLQVPGAPRLPPGTAHLWFLYYLLLFGVLHWVVRTLELGAIGRRLIARGPGAWVLILPLLLAPALASVSAPHPAPEGLLPQFWAIVFFGAFFALGALAHGQPGWVDRLRPLTPWLLAGSAACYVAFLWRLRLELAGTPRATASWPTASLEACVSVWLTLLCLSAGRHLLDRPSPVGRYLAQGAYWTYLLHLPLLFVIQYRLMDLELAWPLKYTVSWAATLALCLLSYQVMVRHTPLRRFVG